MPRGRARVQGPVALEARLQGLARHELHGEVRHALHLAALQDADDVGMVQGAADLRLAQEALQELRLLQERGQRPLERADLAAPLGLVDRGHAPAAQRARAGGTRRSTRCRRRRGARRGCPMPGRRARARAWARVEDARVQRRGRGRVRRGRRRAHAVSASSTTATAPKSSEPPVGRRLQRGQPAAEVAQLPGGELDVLDQRRWCPGSARRRRWRPGGMPLRTSRPHSGSVVPISSSSR